LKAEVTGDLPGKMIFDFLLSVMEKIAEVDCVCTKPAGAFYVFPYFEGVDDLKLADELLDKGLGTVPGTPFGSLGKGCIRLSYGSASNEDLAKAIDIIKDTTE